MCHLHGVKRANGARLRQMTAELIRVLLIPHRSGQTDRQVSVSLLEKRKCKVYSKSPAFGWEDVTRGDIGTQQFMLVHGELVIN